MYGAVQPCVGVPVWDPSRTCLCSLIFLCSCCTVELFPNFFRQNRPGAPSTQPKTSTTRPLLRPCS
uniref:Uncharacterized protein n=1 Tax=Triticum urartu TaxID=4572 RepID=A0A8R7TPW4_TRIUA